MGLAEDLTYSPATATATIGAALIINAMMDQVMVNAGPAIATINRQTKT